MKKITIALLTFLLGVLAFDLLHSEKAAVSQTVAPIQVNVEIPQIKTLDAPIQKADDFKPFFDSFRVDEGYSGWLIADKFKGMKEVWTILIMRDNENSDTNEKLVWSAMILTQHADYSPNDDDDFQSVWIRTEKNRLSFKTDKIRGIEYKFDGKFFKSGNDFSDDDKVLTGTLEKIVRGKTVAKFTADFAYHEPVCFH